MSEDPFFIHIRADDWRRRSHAGPSELVLFDADPDRRAAFEQATHRLGVRVHPVATLEQLLTLLKTCIPDLVVSSHAQVQVGSSELHHDVQRLGALLDSTPWHSNWAVFTEDAMTQLLAREELPSRVERLLVEMDEALAPN